MPVFLTRKRREVHKCTMLPRRAWPGVVGTLLLLVSGAGTHDPSGKLDYGDAHGLRELEYPTDFPEELKGLEDDGQFKPEPAVQGMVLGSIFQRLENLEELCKVHLETGEPRSTPAALNLVPGGFDEGVQLKQTPSRSNGRPGHVLLHRHFDSQVDPEGQSHLLQESVQTLTKDQEKIRQDLERVAREMNVMRQELEEVKQTINVTKSEMTSAAKMADSQIRLQETILDRLIYNFSNMDLSLGGFQQKINDVSNLNKSVLVTMKTQRQANRKLSSLSSDVVVLKENVAGIKEHWNRTMKEAGKRLEKSFTVGKELNKLQKQFHTMKARVTKVHGMKCESGSMLFHNYPFSFGRWPQSRVVSFSRPFSRRPQMTYGMTQLDVNYRYNTRAKVRVHRLSAANFTLSCDGWYNTRLYKVEVSWMACVV